MKRDLCILAVLAVAVAAVLCFVDVKTPSAYYDVHPDAITEDTPTVTLHIDATRAKDCPDVPAAVREGLGDGTLLNETAYALKSGDTALSLLQRVCRYTRLLLDCEGAYVLGIAGLYQLDGGALSGWIVLVNDRKLDRSAGAQKLHAGDRVVWAYSLRLGDDV